METYVNLWYLPELFLEWEIFQVKFVEKFRVNIFSSMLFLIKQFLLWYNLEKYGTARGVTRGNVMQCRKDAIFMPDNEGNV